MTPRDYQAFGVGALWQWFRAHQEGHPVIRMPTGTGKSPLIAFLIQQAYGWEPNLRVMMLTSSQTLIEQNYDKMLKVWPDAPIGIYSAGLGQRDIYNPIIFAGIQSVADKAKSFGKVDLIFIDECDRVPDDKKSEYRVFLAQMMKQNPDLRIIGLTATDWRTGTGRITESDGALFTDVAVDMGSMEAYNWFMEQGYLIELISTRLSTQLDTDGVKIIGGEYNLTQLERAVNKDDLTIAAIEEAIALGAMGRRKWLVFCAGIPHTINTAALLNSYGIEARVCHSKAKKQSLKNIEWFRDYDGDGPVALVNNDILTVGFDDPSIDLLFILRPTMSSRLWVQILGRGTRPWYMEGFDLETQEGRLAAIQASPKHNCLVLDFARNVEKLGPINDPVIPKKKGKGGPAPAPVKVCPECEAHVHTSVRKCNHILFEKTDTTPEKRCGYEFPFELHIDVTASQENMVAKTKPTIIEHFRVDTVNYIKKPSRSIGADPLLHVRYYCGIRMFDEYVCIGHPEGSAARRRANKWWQKRASDANLPLPQNIVQALAMAGKLRTPTHLSVNLTEKYPVITDHCFDGTCFGREQVTDPYALTAPKIYVADPTKETRIPGRHLTFDEEIEG